MTTSEVATIIHAQEASSVQGASAEDGDVELLRELQQQLLRAVTSNRSKDAAIAHIASVVAEATDPAMMFYLERDASELWSAPRSFHSKSQDIPAKLQQQLHAWCDDACRHGNVQINALDPSQGTIAVTAPILLKGAPPDAFATIYQRNTQSVDCLVVIHQLIAVHVALWQVLGQARQAEFEAQTTASLMELLANLETSSDISEVCRRLVNELQNHLGCHRVALGLYGRRKNHCRLVGLSGTDQFDKRSEMARILEAALDEVVVRENLTVWPTTDDAQRQGGRALEKLRMTTAAAYVIGCPLRDDEDELIGAWLFLGATEFGERESNRNFIEASVRPIGSRIRMLQNAHKGLLPRFAQTVLGRSRTSRRKLAICAVGLVTAILCMPLPYTIRCECVLEPVVRRVVVSPYDGILQKAYVEPGDMVSHNDVLARMDEREIQWELAGLDAEYNRAKKERDTTLAKRDVAAAQRAKLEMTRLDLKRELLQHRGANLEIKCPIDGIVIRGDLEKVEGAPLSIGETMFEIAPLDALFVELAIEDREVSHVPDGAEVEIRLEAYPWQNWNGTVARIWPRSEIRDQKNVFIAEVKLDNAESQLRPGMKGRAKIIGRRHPMGWNLLHKPCESFLLWTGW